MIIQGKAVAPASAITIAAELILNSDGGIECVLSSVDDNIVTTADSELKTDIGNITISRALGAIPRSFTFVNGWTFTADNNAKIDIWLRQQNKQSWLHKLEKNSIAITASILLSCLSAWYVINSGIPAISGMIAQSIPPVVEKHLADYSLEYLDEHYFTVSKLSAKRQSELTGLLNNINSAAIVYNGEPKLLFRSLADTANAFTLTDGTIILTDKLVALVQDDRELKAVLLHEIGHQYHNHLLKQLVQASILSVLVNYIVGDATGIGDTLASASTLLLSFEHSQQAELEADRFAAEALISEYGSVQPLEQVLMQLESEPLSSPTWLRSHPDISERVNAINLIDPL
ncbi:Zn-dependent protease with chaperone function [Moritella viscosa]|uniref:M48 family metallopeptidase n=1 Tax=Moritella viscosa TaxID=80854 RepID=UPI00050912C3|nr:M48 family metallopeptidase [Moritella viscosa]CED60037.1 metalloproteases, peptidase family M48 [Moritella viscosa]SHO15164.1 Zn-dependent protease with chaperone function [Moritella viscosa]SHO23715.1 Zn-dependent protease with chaperone function [Moritella viscosa]